MLGLYLIEGNTIFEEEAEEKVRHSRYKENVTWIAAEMPGALTETGMHVGSLT